MCLSGWPWLEMRGLIMLRYSAKIRVFSWEMIRGIGVDLKPRGWQVLWERGAAGGGGGPDPLLDVKRGHLCSGTVLGPGLFFLTSRGRGSFLNSRLASLSLVQTCLIRPPHGQSFFFPVPAAP